LWSGDEKGMRFQDVHLCRAHLHNVAVIAAASGNEHRDLMPREEHIIELCHAYLRIEERILGPGFETTEELVALLRGSPTFASYPITREAVEEATLKIAMGRLLRSQWDSRMMPYQGIPRAWELLRRLYARRPETDLAQRHAKVLSIEPRAYLRAGFALFGLLSSAKLVGFHDVSTTNFKGDIDKPLELDVSSLELVASRLSRTREELRGWHDGLRLMDPFDQKYAPSPLVETPLIRLDSSFPGAKGNGREVLCPSPSHFVWALQTSAVHALPAATLPGENLLSDLGEVLTAYVGDLLRHTCGPEAVFDLDALGIPGKKADFIVRDGPHALVIEVK
jgi:hypothetical protein